MLCSLVGVGVFERSDDHAQGRPKRSLTRSVKIPRFLISHFPSGSRALDERSTPERSDEVRNEA